MAKKCCWEVMACGRQPGGPMAEVHGVCPATTCELLDGANGGRNGGRACWVVVGTFCVGEVQGTFAQKLTTCEKCRFYDEVREEEGENFVLAPLLARMLRKRL